MIRFPLIDRLQISSTGANPASPRRPGALRRQVGLWGGILVFVAMMVMTPPSGMGMVAWHAAALAALMAVWWLSEAIPIAATALVPVALAPMLGLAPVGQVTQHYANPLLFMFLGGFVIAIAMERWNLHRRIALLILKRVGFCPRALVGGFIAATAFLSMWVSNTATATMMLPIALSIINLLKDQQAKAPDVTGVVAEPGETKDAVKGGDPDIEQLDPSTRNFAMALLFGIAFGASIGGIGTLIGTPPNALLAGYLASNFDIAIGFGQWMVLGVPFAAVLLVLCWVVLTRFVYPQADDLPAAACAALERDIATLGPMSRGEKSVAIVFVATASLWLLRPLIEVALPALPISDASIAMLAAIVLFALPVNARENVHVLDWKATLRLPWGVLLLVGGGLALGAMINDSGLAVWVAGNAGALPDLPVFVQITLIAAMVILISHLTSNTATAATFLPLVATYALGEGIDPLLLAVPVALAASCAFMLPVATPPNAIVFASGYLTVGDMVRAGAVVNLIGLVLLVLFSILLVPILFG
ncbi:DASS family sodium-coupled anion symporter [Thalassospira alkalitolerans]|uniref:SLC13 family permease n=1 Tax=Thalassospira alkalitolerans TaxID=1293890 RepID=UPI0030EBAEB1|tara:strand:+ start:47575 stop:49170 length:1596 start_codon:yes stop_codon:yes gene_type:complete